MKHLVATLTIGICLIPLCFGAELDLTQRFLLLATTKTSTMQNELNEASAAGYRILTATGGEEMAIILEKVATPPANYEYLLLATTESQTMQEELGESASQGFRIIPSTMITNSRWFGSEIVMVLEKGPGVSQKYDYLLLATIRTSTLQKEMSQAVDGGYEVVGMIGGHLVVLEKAAKATLSQ